MNKIKYEEFKDNPLNYMLLAQKQDLIITRNGKDLARLSGLNYRNDCVSEEILSQGYGLRKATYEEFQELTKDSQERYEYIDGEIFLQASPKVDHQFTAAKILHIFFDFFNGKTCQAFTAPFDITISRREGDINVVQPDLMVICDLEEKLGKDGYYYGVPDLIVEILSASTRRYDLLKKLNLYLDGGVKEYWVVDPNSRQITIYQFKNGDITTFISFSGAEKAKSFLFTNLEVDLENVFF